MREGRIRLLSSKEAKKVLADFSSIFGKDSVRFFGDKPMIEAVETINGTLYSIERRPVLVEIEEKLIPTLTFNELLERLPWVFVDRGAIPHVCNGADIMAPGITDIKGSFNENTLVVVADNEHKKALAIGTTIHSDDEIRQMKKGKAIKSIHYVGDSIWDKLKERSGRTKLKDSGCKA